MKKKLKLRLCATCAIAMACCFGLPAVGNVFAAEDGGKIDPLVATLSSSTLRDIYTADRDYSIDVTLELHQDVGVASFWVELAMPEFAIVDASSITLGDDFANPEAQDGARTIDYNNRLLKVLVNTPVDRNGTNLHLFTIDFTVAEAPTANGYYGQPQVTQWQFTNTQAQELQPVEVQMGDISIFPEASQDDRAMGDINNDGTIDLADLIYGQRALLNVQQTYLQPEDEYYADINRDKRFDLVDLQYLQQYLAKTIDSLEDIGGQQDIESICVTTVFMSYEKGFSDPVKTFEMQSYIPANMTVRDIMAENTNADWQCEGIFTDEELTTFLPYGATLQEGQTIYILQSRNPIQAENFLTLHFLTADGAEVFLDQGIGYETTTPVLTFPYELGDTFENIIDWKFITYLAETAGFNVMDGLYVDAERQRSISLQNQIRENTTDVFVQVAPISYAGEYSIVALDYEAMANDVPALIDALMLNFTDPQAAADADMMNALMPIIGDYIRPFPSYLTLGEATPDAMPFASITLPADEDHEQIVSNGKYAALQNGLFMVQTWEGSEYSTMEQQQGIMLMLTPPTADEQTNSRGIMLLLTQVAGANYTTDAQGEPLTAEPAPIADTIYIPTSQPNFPIQFTPYNNGLAVVGYNNIEFLVPYDAFPNESGYGIASKNIIGVDAVKIALYPGDEGQYYPEIIVGADDFDGETTAYIVTGAGEQLGLEPFGKITYTYDEDKDTLTADIAVLQGEDYVVPEGYSNLPINYEYACIDGVNVRTVNIDTGTEQFVIAGIGNANFILHHFDYSDIDTQSKKYADYAGHYSILPEYFSGLGELVGIDLGADGKFYLPLGDTDCMGKYIIENGEIRFLSPVMGMHLSPMRFVDVETANILGAAIGQEWMIVDAMEYGGSIGSAKLSAPSAEGRGMALVSMFDGDFDGTYFVEEADGQTIIHITGTNTPRTLTLVISPNGTLCVFQPEQGGKE